MLKKDQHIEYSLKSISNDSLKGVQLKYCSIPRYSIDDIDISTKFCGIDFDYPIYINAITGGSNRANDINKRLYYIAKKTGIFLFSGSYSPALKNKEYYYPKNFGVNLGADKSLEEMKIAIKETNARILQIHLNPMQELMMFDGDRDFRLYRLNISNALMLDIPVIVKETGYGMDDNTLDILYKLGVKTVDISGSGGTNFSYIEDMRSNKNRDYLYEVAYTTLESLLYSQSYIDKMEILASGGISNPLSVVKALSMGARAVGIAGYILKLLQEKSNEEIIEIIEEWKYEIKMLFLITDSKNISELRGKWRKKC